MFENRETAGRLLGEALRHHAGPRTIVLGLPRGGVPVAERIAQRLGATLDVWIARKLGVPYHRELAMGAIGEGGELVIDTALIRELGIEDVLVSEVIQRETAEARRRVRVFRGDRDEPDVRGRTAIVVDDGVATGATARAALRDLRARGAKRLVFAAPVGASRALAALRGDADEVVCLEQPIRLGSVGAWYTDFRQLDDHDVIDILERNRHHHHARVA
jgi:predicted phosphoribosyltransferase